MTTSILKADRPSELEAPIRRSPRPLPYVNTMKYTAIAVCLTTVVISGLAKFELSARENLMLVQQHRGGDRREPPKDKETKLSMNGGTESSGDDGGYTAPNNGGPDSQHGSGTR